ncbi:MAG: hypothetical protein ACFFG0_06040 [Candidatus Thorarchaeota archaeon]
MDYFKVENAIERIEQSTQPDIEKIKILHEEGKRIFRDLRLDKTNKINALKWDQNKNVNIIKEMTEEEIYKEMLKAEQERFDMKADELVTRNSLSLATHYKSYFIQINPIIRYLEYTFKILERVNTTIRVVDDYKMKKEIEYLRDKVDEMETEKSMLEVELRDQLKKVENSKKDFVDLLFNEKMYKLMGKFYLEKITDGDLIKLVFYLHLNNNSKLKEIYHKIRISPKKINKMIIANPDFFKYDENTELISLNNDPIKNELTFEELERHVDVIQNKPETPQVREKINKFMKSIFKKDKKKSVKKK